MTGSAPPSKGDGVRLSVSIVTYQQADYVRQALDSVLLQRTDFPIEIVVGDDASTDGTREVLRDIAAEHPHRVRLLLHERNLGDRGLSNFMSTVEASRGEYIAFLDGDDYWTDPYKLQRQVDFLDAHPECALCAHRVVHLWDDGSTELSIRPFFHDAQEASVHDVGELMVENFAPKISTVVRQRTVSELPDWYRHTRIASADWLFNVLAGRLGRIGYFSETMAMHRKRADNLTAFYGAQRMLSDKLAALEQLRPLFPDHSIPLQEAGKRLRWKRRFARLGPRAYGLVRRLNVPPRPRA